QLLDGALEAAQGHVEGLVFFNADGGHQVKVCRMWPGGDRSPGRDPQSGKGGAVEGRPEKLAVDYSPPLPAGRAPAGHAAQAAWSPRWLEARTLSRGSGCPVRSASIQSAVEATAAKLLWKTTQKTRWISSALARPAALA